MERGERERGEGVEEREKGIEEREKLRKVVQRKKKQKEILLDCLQSFL